MTNWLWEKRKSRCEIEIDHVYDALEGLHPSMPEYTASVNNLKTLKSLDQSGVDKNTLITVGGYLGVAGMAIIAELFGHSITSRAMSFALPKPKL